jgi:hypothetical protein
VGNANEACPALELLNDALKRRRLAYKNIPDAHARILDLIKRRRTEENDPSIGASIERQILRRALARYEDNGGV